MTNQTIRVLIADDHAVVREGIRQVLSPKHGFEVVAEAENSAQTLALMRDHEPDIVLLDITMPGKSGLDITSDLRSEFPDIPVLMLTMHDRGEYVLEAVRAGAKGYVLKDALPNQLRQAVRTVVEGQEYFSEETSSKLSDALRTEIAHERKRSSLGALTSREQEVLQLVANGSTSKEIGASLNISPRTVESHRENIMRKLDIRSIAQLTRFAIEVGLVEE